MGHNVPTTSSRAQFGHERPKIIKKKGRPLRCYYKGPWPIGHNVRQQRVNNVFARATGRFRGNDNKARPSDSHLLCCAIIHGLYSTSSASPSYFTPLTDSTAPPPPSPPFVLNLFNFPFQLSADRTGAQHSVSFCLSKPWLQVGVFSSSPPEV